MHGNTKPLLLLLVGIVGGCPAAGGLAAPASVNVVEMTTTTAEEGMAAARFTSRELTEAFLTRIATYNSSYHAIITFNPGALAEADAQDQRRAAGESLGPLSGIPVVVKDTMDMAGLPTT